MSASKNVYDVWRAVLRTLSLGPYCWILLVLCRTVGVAHVAHRHRRMLPINPKNKNLYQFFTVQLEQTFHFSRGITTRTNVRKIGSPKKKGLAVLKKKQLRASSRTVVFTQREDFGCTSSSVSILEYCNPIGLYTINLDVLSSSSFSIFCYFLCHCPFPCAQPSFVAMFVASSYDNDQSMSLLFFV